MVPKISTDCLSKANFNLEFILISPNQTFLNKMYVSLFKFPKSI